MQIVPRTIYLPKDLDDYIGQRCLINGRSRTKEIEHILKKMLKIEIDENRKLIAGLDRVPNPEPPLL